jgi:hypothetical protein
MTIYRPVTLQIQEFDDKGEPKPKQSVFEIHLGSPGKPKIYRRRRGQLRRVEDGPTLMMVASAFRRTVDAGKATDERMEKRRQKWWYKFFEWCYDLPRRIYESASDAIGPSWRSWFSK